MVGHPTNDFKPGNQLRFTCSFRKSQPKPIVSWFVDGQEVRRLYDYHQPVNQYLVSVYVSVCVCVSITIYQMLPVASNQSKAEEKLVEQDLMSSLAADCAKSFSVHTQTHTSHAQRL